ncbi:hypothetical protein [Acidithiobacillus ferrivorans]|nr:hypothetical protein [Acidithiobacillus ferrivorans]
MLRAFWGVLSSRSASDADLWIAYTLLEALRQGIISRLAHPILVAPL